MQVTSLQPTHTVNEAVAYIQAMPTTLRQEVFDFIDFMRLKQVRHIEAEPPLPKREFGQYQGKGSFEMADDSEMTEEELINL
ncbi:MULTISPECIES: hypothetical protein [unclassified Moraxella]|uniref:hypothetical protein n=1 Tax=unclassified Moraxella TaxID=2685852 RepID=UPI003AF85DA1